MCIRTASMLEPYNKRRSIDLDAQLARILPLNWWRQSSLVAGNPLNLMDYLLEFFANTWRISEKNSKKGEPLNAHAEIIFISKA